MKIYLILLICLLNVSAFSQCSGGTNAGAITPTTNWQTITVSAGSYYTFTVPPGSCETYDFSFCQGGGSASFDSQITILNNSNVYANAYSDDACGVASQILAYSPSTSGIYRVLINNYYCGTSGATATLAYKKNAPGTNANYQYLSNASVSGNCITLTTATNDQRGCAWDVNSTLNFATDFSYNFTVNLGSSDAGADGMAFVIQNDPQGRCECGTAGGSMGAGGITNSLTVEIDTYLNTEDRDDGMAGVLCSGGSEPDHLDIWLNGVINPEYGSSCVTDAGERIVPAAVPLMSGSSIYNIENGNNHILRVSWSAANNTLTASILNTGLTITYGSISYSFNPLTVFGTTTPYFGFTASTGGLNNQQNYCLPNILLPVELISFTAQCETDQVKITWASASEFQNQYYHIEKSTDGINYYEIAKVYGAGSSNHYNEYSVFTEKPNQINYFRILQSDFNGLKKEIAAPIAVNCEKNESEIVMYPNPATNEFFINFNGPSDYNFEIEIYDLIGKLIFTNTIDKDATQIRVATDEFESGIYMVNLKSRNTTLSTRKINIIKQ